MITFFLFLALTTLSLFPEISFSLPSSNETIIRAGIDNISIKQAPPEHCVLYINKASSQNNFYTPFPRLSYYEPPQGGQSRYSHSERALLRSFSSEDFRDI